MIYNVLTNFENHYYIFNYSYNSSTTQYNLKLLIILTFLAGFMSVLYSMREVESEKITDTSGFNLHGVLGDSVGDTSHSPTQTGSNGL